MFASLILTLIAHNFEFRSQYLYVGKVKSRKILWDVKGKKKENKNEKETT